MILYCSIMFILYLWFLISISIIEDLNDFYINTFQIIGALNYIIFCILNLINTSISTYAIINLLIEVYKLKKDNSWIKFDFFYFIIHCILLILQFSIILAFSLPSKSRSKKQVSIYLPLIDTVVQILICYICWT